MGANPHDTETLADLNAAELEREIAMRRVGVQSAERFAWDAVCEKMARELKGLFPEARFIALQEDSGEFGPMWGLDSILDAQGRTLADYTSQVEGVAERYAQFESSFASEYSGDYEACFGVDERPYFDIEAQTPLDLEGFMDATRPAQVSEVAQ